MNEDDVATAALLEFLNATEAGIATAKRLIKEAKNINQEPTWDPNKIKWKQAQGTSGSYERSEDLDSQDFKHLVKDLAQHDGKLSKEAYFYWLFQNGSTVGRKKRT
jgi:hypothetical protein